MSDTYHGGKGPGYDYWKNRPEGKALMTPGSFTKKMTHKIERRIDKQKIRNEDFDSLSDKRPY